MMFHHGQSVANACNNFMEIKRGNFPGSCNPESRQIVKWAEQPLPSWMIVLSIQSIQQDVTAWTLNLKKIYLKTLHCKLMGQENVYHWETN